jgi:hypothetical protein
MIHKDSLDYPLVEKEKEKDNSDQLVEPPEPEAATDDAS